MRSQSEWQHAFGPTGSPVTIAGWSEPVRRLVSAIRTLGEPEKAKCVLVEGGDGSGKSLAAAAFQAACQSQGANAVLLNEGTDPAAVMRRAAGGDALIVDNLDQFSEGLRKALFDRRHAAPNGSLLTTSRMSALERELLGADDAHHPIGRLEDRPADLLILASLPWEDLGQSPGLHEVCSEGVAEALSVGPWSRGAHSVRRAVAILAETLELEAYPERPRLIEPGDVHRVVIGVILEERPPETEDSIRIVVEGSTDAVYIQRAGQLASDEWGVDLLSGCQVAPPGEEREGGAEKAVRELLRLEVQGITAVALFDDDDPGRAAARNARNLTTQKVLLLPAEFDPLNAPRGSETIEIEDLVPLPLLERFYSTHRDLRPEETTVRRDLTRIVVAGPDKELAANWICQHATFDDMQKVVCVLCMLRESIGLPLPDACPSIPEWMKELTA
jgi:hypothetical protein